MDRIRGKAIAITGAARGIGLATATALLDRGARVVIGDRDLAELGIALDSVRDAPLTGHPLDVTDRDSFADFLEHARHDVGGPIEVLINNAGVMPVGSFLDETTRTIQTTVDVNIHGVLNGCQLVLPDMVSRRSGHIINIASMAGVVALPGQVVYAATKFAVVGLSRAMADEFAPHGVEISTVLPPFTQTELIAGTPTGNRTRVLHPSEVATAVVGVLDRPRTECPLPPSMRYASALLSTLTPRMRRWLFRRSGIDRTFLDFDAAARRAYHQRVERSTGIVKPSDGPSSPRDHAVSEPSAAADIENRRAHGAE
ncbi:SDR family oxidoreductase [Nocardia pseudovaccinii]|uniref:SDR family oxidoreductase n=1 Tax=Nocardia pseudovaccinii TaxID=189540 RepID=UPI0007A54BC2|nr:SDR family oxidoreductase [Nocardia pseudovaccinii]